MKDLKIHFLNTVWSDSIILESEKHYAFVDTASKFYYPMITDYLKSLDNPTIDFILLTHFHSDHYGNIINIINDYKVNKLYLKHYAGCEGDTGSGYPTNEEYVNHEMSIFNEIINTAKEHNVEIIFLDNLDLTDPYIINFNGIEIELYNIKNNLEILFNDESLDCYKKHIFSENSNSILSFIKHNGHNICLGADLTETDSPYELVNRLSEQVINKIYKKHNIDCIDVLKAPHHAGSGSNKEALGKLVKAKYVIMTNMDKWLDNWTTRDNFKKGNPDVILLQTDYNQYVFDFSDLIITYDAKPIISLFIKLNMQ